MEKLQEDYYLQREVETYKWTATILADTIFLKMQGLSGPFWFVYGFINKRMWECIMK